MTRLATGDLVLFTSAPTWRAWLFGPSEQFTRVGMVLVDPPAPFAVPRGTYLWSGLTGLEELGAAIGDAAVVVRKCTLRVAEQRLLAIRADQDAVSGRDSELVAYVLTRLGWLSDATDCTAVRPCDLSSSSTRLAWDVGSAYMRDEPYRAGARETELLLVPAASLCDALVAKLASIGVPAARVSESEARVGLPRGRLDILCAPGPSFVARATDRSPRAFDSQRALVRYVTEVLDAHLLAVIS